MKRFDGRPANARQRGLITYGLLAAGGTTNGTVTFTTPFLGAPDVSINVTSSRVNIAVNTVTATGFTWSAANWSPSAVITGQDFARWVATPQ